MHNKIYSAHKTDLGFSLIELMVAMVIGLFLIGGVIAVQVAGHRTYGVSESQVHMLDDGRFSMDLLGRDIRMAGGWGNGGDVNNMGGAKGKTDVLAAISGDCEENWYNDVLLRMYGTNDSNPYTGACIGTDYLADTDVLVLRYALPDQVVNAALVPNMTYVQVGQQKVTDGEVESGEFLRSQLFVAGVNPTPVFGVDNNYVVQSIAYYVSDYTNSVGDGVPSLHRIILSAGSIDDGGPVLRDELIAPGVVNFQVQYGVDLNEDGSLDSYVDANDIDWTDSTAREQVAAVRIWILLRSEDPESIMDNNTYTMGTTTYTPANYYRHKLISGVFNLRNRVHSS